MKMRFYYSNISFVLIQAARQQKPVFFFLLLKAVSGCILAYIWTFFITVIFSLVEQQASLNLFLKVLLGFAAGVLICQYLGGISDYQCSWRFCSIRIALVLKRMQKIMKMDYQDLEKPEILDWNEKAHRASNGRDVGIEGVLNEGASLLTHVFTILSACIIIAPWNIQVLGLIFLVSVVLQLSINKVVQWDKEFTWDRLIPFWRKARYLERASFDFTFAKEIHMFGIKGFLNNKVKTVNGSIQERIVESKNRWLGYNLVVQLISAFCELVVYGYLIAGVYRNRIDLVAFILYFGTLKVLFTEIKEFRSGIANMKGKVLQTADFRNFMDAECSKADMEGQLPKLTEKAEFEFQDVSFRYQGQEEWVLHHLNLKLESNDKLAIVGLNGAGKTSIIKLLCRLYQPVEGKILLNGVDIQFYQKEAYWKLFAPVFQDTELFAMPIWQNIIMKEEKEISEERMERILQFTGLHHIIDNCKKGMDTPLSRIMEEEGKELSGGEKQWIRNARGLYRDAKVLILDEPTSAMDPFAEEKFFLGITEFLQENSVIFITHRLSSIRFCDHIAFLEDGYVKEYGSHDELLRLGGGYARLFELQARRYRSGESEVEAP